MAPSRSSSLIPDKWRTKSLPAGAWMALWGILRLKSSPHCMAGTPAKFDAPVLAAHRTIAMLKPIEVILRMSAGLPRAVPAR